MYSNERYPDFIYVLEYYTTDLILVITASDMGDLCRFWCYSNHTESRVYSLGINAIFDRTLTRVLCELRNLEYV